MLRHNGYALIEADNGTPAWFMQGSQHDRHTASKVSGSDILGHSFKAKVPTNITFFQNSAGMRKWPTTQAKMEALVKAIQTQPEPALFKLAKNFSAGVSGRAKRKKVVL